MKKTAFLSLLLWIAVQMGAQNYQTCNADEFAQVIKNKKTYVIDARSPQAYLQEHIAKARWISDEDWDEEVKKLKTKFTIAIYGQNDEAAPLAEKYSRLGYNVVALAGGIDAWKAEGGAVKKLDLKTVYYLSLTDYFHNYFHDYRLNDTETDVNLGQWLRCEGRGAICLGEEYLKYGKFVTPILFSNLITAEEYKGGLLLRYYTDERTNITTLELDLPKNVAFEIKSTNGEKTTAYRGLIE